MKLYALDHSLINNRHHTKYTTPLIFSLNHSTTKLKTIYPKAIKNNLIRQEINASKDLQTRDDIIIINADNGGAITILDAEDYVKEANRQLNDEQCYQKLRSNPTRPTQLTLLSTCSSLDIRSQRKL